MEHFTEDPGIFYCCRRHKFAIKVFLADTGEGSVGGVGLRPLNCLIAVSNIAGGMDVCLL